MPGKPPSTPVKDLGNRQPYATVTIVSSSFKSSLGQVIIHESEIICHNDEIVLRS
jgi:hypothetical protein